MDFSLQRGIVKTAEMCYNLKEKFQQTGYFDPFLDR